MSGQQPIYYHYPGRITPKKPRPFGCGCGLIGLALGFIATLLGIAALFLPPFNLGERLFPQAYQTLNDQTPAISRDGLYIALENPTPDSDFALRIDSITPETFRSDPQTPWITRARAFLPPTLTLHSRIYRLQSSGTPASPLTLTLDLTSPAPAQLDLYAWDDDARRWEFIPSQPAADLPQRITRLDTLPQYLALFEPAPIAPIVITTLESGQRLSAQTQPLIDILRPAGMRPALPPGAQSTLAGNPARGFRLDADYRVMPVIRNYADLRAADAATVIALLESPTLRDQHLQQLTAFAAAGNYDGLFIDYRGLPPEAQPLFTDFIYQLSAALHSGGLELGVTLTAPLTDADLTGIDWHTLDQASDYLELAFDHDPRRFAADDDTLIRIFGWLTGEISRYHLIAGLSALSAQEAGGTLTALGYEQALASSGNVQLSVNALTGGALTPGSPIRLALDGFTALPGFDTNLHTPYIQYLDDSGELRSTAWLTTGAALAHRLNRFASLYLGGAAVDHLLADGVIPDIYAAAQNYRAGFSAPATSPDLALTWRIEGRGGVITEFDTNLTEPIVVTLNAPQGEYTVNAEIVGAGFSSQRESAQIALFAPTITPTRLPTNTPAPFPTITPTLRPIIATPTGLPNIFSGLALNPGAGSIVANFEYGGHVMDTATSAAGWMRDAGMTWMKMQVRFTVGTDTSGAARAIQQAHSQGFRVLIGVVGDPAEVAFGGAGYTRAFADHVAAIAALGPDAIEIWNEPNLDREWPRGQISGGRFTDLLRESYLAIKARNPNVLVIAGAPAPTGAEASFPGQVVNDDRFIQEMVAAGALQFMDCMGMHYNEGILPPSVTSGDPRGDYYTRYLPTLIETYTTLIGGQRPLCITELGYLSPEGYPPLPSFFGWAGGVTVGQQAAWLAEAAAIASRSGRVRLLIVWNVDFTRYDDDPQAGYAIIRPGGDCPACRALGSAR